VKRHLSIAAFVALTSAPFLAPGARAQGTVTALGRVVDGEGNPVPGVQVLLEYKGHVVQKYRTRTDKKGNYIHLNVYSGPYRITLKKEGVGEVSFDYTIQEIPSTGRPPEFKLTARPAATPPPPGSGLAPAGGSAPGTPPVDLAKLTADIDAASALSDQGHVDEAVTALEAITARVPQIPLAHYELADACKKKGDVSRAEAEYRKAVELDPRFVDGYVGLGTLLAEGGRRDEAIEAVAQGAARNEESGRLQYALGVLEMGVGRNREAKAAFLKALELDPPNYDSHYHLATVCLNMNDKAGAVAELEKFLAEAPADHPNAALAKSLMEALKK
jgi:Tfp pilus assembly protein PilF